jgi:hypothetical protein
MLSLVIPLLVLEIGTSLAAPSNGFLSDKSIRSIVLKHQVKIRVNGMLSQIKIIFYNREETSCCFAFKK